LPEEELSMSEILALLEMVGLLSPAEAAKYLSIGRTKLYAEINSGRLKAKRNGGQTVIAKEELDRYIADLPDHQPSETSRSAMMRVVQLRRRIAP
jgi:excisionase family DNA binding protein